MFKMLQKLFEKSIELDLEKLDSPRDGNTDEDESKPQTQPSQADLSKKPEDIKIVNTFSTTKAEVRDRFSSQMEHSDLYNVWLNISELMSYLWGELEESKRVLRAMTSKLQPQIECFFIVYKILCDDEILENIHFKLNPNLSNKQSSNFDSKNAKLANLEVSNINPDDIEISNLTFEELRNKEQVLDINRMFIMMCEKNKHILNHMIKQNINLLADSLSVLPKKIPKILDFENKRAYFRLSIGKSQHQHPIRLMIRRTEIFPDSYNQLMAKSAVELKGKLQIEFKNEEGYDAGGVTREWFLSLSKLIFDPIYALFIPSAAGVTYQPSPQSYVNPDHCNFFKFIGRIIGKALHDGYLLDAYFTRSLYKHMTGSPISYHDYEDIDPDYYRNLKWILSNDITDMDLTFSYEADNFGETVIRDLKPGGRNIEVTEDNKLEYINSLCYAKMATDIKAQIESFLSGLHEIVPRDLLSIFDPRELELMISGLPEIDLADMKANTEYTNYTKDSRVIKWFWQLQDEFDNNMRANFQQFVTGTSKVPLEGFKGLKGMGGQIQKFNIHKAYDPKMLPTSHTCMNQLDIAEYDSKEVLADKLITAITWGKEGFGFV